MTPVVPPRQEPSKFPELLEQSLANLRAVESELSVISPREAKKVKAVIKTVEDINRNTSVLREKIDNNYIGEVNQIKEQTPRTIDEWNTYGQPKKPNWK